MKSYVDPTFRSATYQSLKRLDQPVPVVLEVMFQVNGKEKSQVKPTLQRAVLKALDASRLLVVTASSENTPTARLKIVVNNVADLGAAAGKGVGTGLTLGLAGSEVVDGYVMTANYTPPGNASVTKNYKHAIHTTIGAHAAPEGMVSVSLDAAFERVIEDMILNLLRDLQSDHLL